MSKKIRKISNQDNVHSKRTLLEKCLVFGVIFIFAVLPLLYFPGRVAASVTSKGFFFMGAVDILLCLWGWLLIYDSRYRLSKKNILTLLPIFLFLISLTVSSFLGVESANSFFSNIESGIGMFLLYHTFIFTCIIASLIRVKKQNLLITILQANLLASVILAIATFFTSSAFDIGSKMLNESSGGAMMGNELLAAAYFIFSIFLTAILVILENSKRKKIIYGIGIFIILISPIFFNVEILKGHLSFGLIITSPLNIIGSARMATISLFFGVLLIFCFWAFFFGKKKILKYGGGLGAFLLSFLMILSIWQIFLPNTKMNQLFIKNAGNRPIDWQEAVLGIKEKPLLGWGQENYRFVFQKYLDPVVYSPGHSNEVWNYHPHNSFLEILINGGIVGFILYILVILFLVRNIYLLYKNKIIDSKILVFLLGFIFVYLLQNQMAFDSIVSFVMFFALVGFIAGLSDFLDEKPAIKKLRKFKIFLGILITIIIIPVWILVAYLPARKMEEFQKISNATSQERTAGYWHLFHSAGSYALNTDADFFTGGFARSYSAQTAMLLQNPTYSDFAGKEVQSLIDAVDPVFEKHSLNYRLALSLIHLENLEIFLKTVPGRNPDPVLIALAKKYAEKAISLSPTDPQVYWANAQTYIYEKKYGQAMNILEKGLALNIEVADSHRAIINLTRLMGDERLYQKVLARAQKDISGFLID